MKYGQIRKYDVANGPGIRCSFFVTGCNHKCPQCFNKEYQDFSYGKLWTNEETKKIISYMNLEEIKGLTILGGEPFQNTEDLIEIVGKIREKSHKSIWIYSGYTYEQIQADLLKKKLLSYCDVLVDGLFIIKLKDLRLKFRGSSNQKIIDVKKSQEENKIITIEKFMN